jgi:hypothetical protein
VDTNQSIGVTTVPYGGYRYFQPALYEAVPRADGVLTWRRVKLLDVRTRSKIKAYDTAYDLAMALDVLYNPEIRHGTAITDTPTPKEN